MYLTCSDLHHTFKLCRSRPPLAAGSVTVGRFIFSMPRHRNLKISFSASTMVRLDIRLTVARYHAIDSMLELIRAALPSSDDGATR